MGLFAACGFVPLEDGASTLTVAQDGPQIKGALGTILVILEIVR